MRAFLIDDEPLALNRLERMLRESGQIEIVGQSSDPLEAIGEVARTEPDVLFLDIEMPGLSGFDVLTRLSPQPLVVFTTAYSQYALQAFQVNSVDYLLKPIDKEQLDRALGKLERRQASPRPDIQLLLNQILAARSQEYASRLSSKVGEKVELIELSRVTHLFAEDKLTFAATDTRQHILDQTIAELEKRLDPKKFCRVHRSTIVNLEYVHEMHQYFGGRMLVRLKDAKRTEITVARDRVQGLREKLGL
jgi:two-component system LytT family response regulator